MERSLATSFRIGTWGRGTLWANTLRIGTRAAGTPRKDRHLGIKLAKFVDRNPSGSWIRTQLPLLDELDSSAELLCILNSLHCQPEV